MSDLDPQGPSQPSQQTGLNQEGNAASKTGPETTASHDKSSLGDKTIDHREQHDVPSQHGEAATGSSLGRGETGAFTEKDIGQFEAGDSTSEKPNLEGEQMAAAGEGDVADAVKGGGGGGHAGADSITANLGAKTEAHNKEIHARGEKTGVEQEEDDEDWTGKKVDVGEALSGRDTKIVLAPED